LGIHLGRFGAAIFAAVLLLGTAPALAKPAESQEDSFYSQLESLASRLKADGARAIETAGAATARAVEASKGAIAQTQTDLGPRLETFRKALNEQKAKLAIFGEDAAARFNAWKQAATQSWSEMWSDTWAESGSDTSTDAWADTWTKSWAEIHRAATEALDRFRHWIAAQPDSEEQTETPV